MSDEKGASDMETPGLTDNSEIDSDSDEETHPRRTFFDGKTKSEQLRAEGNDFSKKRLFDEAIAKYTEALQANPDDSDNAAKCYRNMAFCYHKKKDLKRAVGQAILAIQTDPTCALSYVRCGLSYKKMGKVTMAGVVFLKGLSILPKSDQINKEWQTLGQESNDQVRHAEEFFKKNTVSDIRTMEKECEDYVNAQTTNRKQRKEKDSAIPDLINSSGSDSDNDPSDTSNASLESGQILLSEAAIPDLIESSGLESDTDPSDTSNVTFGSDEGSKPSKMRNVTKKKSTDVDVSVPPLSSTDGDSDSDSDSSNPLGGSEKITKEKDLAKETKINTKNEHSKKILREKVLADQKRKENEKKQEEIKEAMRKRELEAKKKENEQKKREEREREILRKREEEKLLQEKERNDPTKEIKARFKTICNEASTCLINTVPSMEGFSQALEMVDKEYKSLWTTQYEDLSHNEEVVVIKYMFARACGQTNNYDCILAGLKKLDEIRDCHKHVKFPTVFYGFSSLWIKLNRFDKAAAAVKDGIDFLERGFNVTPYNWPGIPSKLVEETRKDILLEKLRILAIQLKYPPRPDAVCRWNNCIQNQSHIVPSENIYISDPDYKGYLKVLCRMDCQVCYHKACWIAVKGENIDKLKLTKVPTEKDFLGQSCFTPDCDGVIVKIEIFEDNLSKMTTIQDGKLIEKLEDDEMKRKEEERIKKEREEHEKRVKVFEQKQMKKNNEKQSSNHKEKSEENIAAEKKSNKKRNTNANMQSWSKNDKKKGARGNDEKAKNVGPELTCCYPDGCSQKNRVLNRDDLSETQRVSCSNSKCDQSGYMHLACFLKFESMVVGFLGKQPRGRMWTQQQCINNVWNKKGYEVVFKMCACLCGHGRLRKDSEWMAPKPKAVVKEGATALAPEKKKTEEKVKLETVKESLQPQDDDLGEKNKQRNNNLEQPASESTADIKDNNTDRSNESTKLDERSRHGKMENTTGSTKENVLNLSNSASIITLEDSEELEEIYSVDNTIASPASSNVPGKTFESSHEHAYKPSLGEIAGEMKKKIVAKLNKESPIGAASKQMIPEQISRNSNTKSTNRVNNNGISAPCKENETQSVNTTVSASAQTNLVLMNFGDIDPEALQQQNQSLILQVQEMKDKFYKIQTERKIEAKEYNDKCERMAEDNKNLMIENDSFKEKISKMKKTVTDTTKVSEELRKTNDMLRSTRSQLEDTKKYLNQEQSHSSQINSQLTLVCQEKEVESQLNDLLRAKLLQNDLMKYREILRQKQENNRTVITLLRGSRELDNIPQIQLALSSLNEYSARLLLADEELSNQYATLVRQSEENKTSQELNFDLSSVEPPNLGPSCLGILHNFVILNQLSSHQAASTFSFPPPPIPQSSASSPLLPDLSAITARRDSQVPHAANTIFSNPPPGYATLSTFPGSQVNVPINSSRSTSVSQDSFQTASAPASPTSLSPSISPAWRSEVAKSGVIVANPTNGASATFPTSAGVSATFPSSAGVAASYPTSAGAAALYPTSAGATASYPTSAGATASYPTSAGATSLYPTSAAATASCPTGETALQPTSARASVVKSSFNGAIATNTTSNGATATYPTTNGTAVGSSQSASATNPTGQNVNGTSTKTGKQHDKLVNLLQKKHPNLSPSQALDYVMKVRKSNNGKLSGMSIQDILDKVAVFIHTDEDGDCSICFEDMDSGDSMYLNPCRHRFHKACINQWLESPGGAGSTCPMCRNYIVKEEEYPDLGAARRF